MSSAFAVSCTLKRTISVNLTDIWILSLFSFLDGVKEGIWCLDSSVPSKRSSRRKHAPHCLLIGALLQICQPRVLQNPLASPRPNSLKGSGVMKITLSPSHRDRSEKQMQSQADIPPLGCWAS